MVANPLRPGSGARWLSEIETNGASCISLNSLASALSVAESASFLRSLGNPECEAELIKARSLESDSGSRRWPEPDPEGQVRGRPHYVSSANRPLLAMGTRPQGEYLLKQ